MDYIAEHLYKGIMEEMKEKSEIGVGDLIQNCLENFGVELKGNPMVDIYAHNNMINNGDLVCPLACQDVDADLIFPILPLPDERLSGGGKLVFGDDGCYMIGYATQDKDKYTFIGNANCPAILRNSYEEDAIPYGIFVPFERNKEYPTISDRNAYISKKLIDSFLPNGEFDISMKKLNEFDRKDNEST